MTAATPWLACTGRHDGNGNRSALAFLDHPANLRYPSKWFVRQTPYVDAGFAFMFEAVYAFEAGRLDAAAGAEVAAVCVQIANIGGLTRMFLSACQCTWLCDHGHVRP